MQLGSYFYFTCWLLYMFRALLAPIIIRSITTVYAAPGTSAHRTTSDVHSYQGLHIQLLYSWWWVQEAPETCRVVNKWNKSHYLVFNFAFDYKMTFYFFLIWSVRIKFSFYIWINMVCTWNTVTHHSHRNKIVCLIICQTVCNLPLEHFFCHNFPFPFSYRTDISKAS